jgi:hypothetical protein
MLPLILQALAAEREAHLRDVALLEAKLKWYTENQEIVTQQDETIKMQVRRGDTAHLPSVRLSKTKDIHL